MRLFNFSGFNLKLLSVDIFSHLNVFFIFNEFLQKLLLTAFQNETMLIMYSQNLFFGGVVYVLLSKGTWSHFL